ncbi:hypothetical protein IFM89_008188 [Coptis chinensis]|uniref:Uncharacterized protein n=1 Tax=Coptis chinensis TaxID=261450 RepID=A0A835I348_9MAGN|nr:hypothetical protein IFM89_008188 [Coptis chinensis]
MDKVSPLQLEEHKLQIQAQMLELEKQRFKWQRFSRKKDRELDKLRIENERMKLENELMTPFRGNGNRETLFNVVGRPLKFSDGSTFSFAAKDLIRGLLAKDPKTKIRIQKGSYRNQAASIL